MKVTRFGSLSKVSQKHKLSKLTRHDKSLMFSCRRRFCALASLLPPAGFTVPGITRVRRCAAQKSAMVEEEGGCRGLAWRRKRYKGGRWGGRRGVLAWWRGLLEPAVIKWILPRTEHQIAPAKSTQALKCKR